MPNVVLKRLGAIPIDAFLLALAATVALAALLPAHGSAGEAVSVAAKAAIPGTGCGNGDCTCWC